MTDKEIVDELYRVFKGSLDRLVPRNKQEYTNDSQKGFIRCMELDAKFIIDFIDRYRE